MGKRWRMVDAKPDQLVAAYGRSDTGDLDIQYAWGPGVGLRPTAICVMDAFQRCDVEDGKNLVQILKERGYDITTLKFSISKLPSPTL